MERERKVERLLPKIKETVDSVYEYLTPHPDGIGMVAKEFGKTGGRICTSLVNRGIIKKTNLGRGEYKYRWVATMAPTTALYRSIAAELQAERRQEYEKKKSSSAKTKEAPAVADELIEREKPSGIYWHAIKQGERLPCRAYLWNLSYEKYHDCWEGRLVPNLENVSVGGDTWYLPADDLRALPREGVDELRVEQKAEGPVEQILEMWEKMKQMGVSIENNQLVLTEVKVTKTVLS